MLKKLMPRLISLTAILTLAANNVYASGNGGRRIGPWYAVITIGVPTAIWIYMIFTSKRK